MYLHSLGTLLGTPVQSSAIQYSVSVVNSTFTKLQILSFDVETARKVIILLYAHYSGT